LSLGQNSLLQSQHLATEPIQAGPQVRPRGLAFTRGANQGEQLGLVVPDLLQHLAGQLAGRTNLEAVALCSGNVYPIREDDG
jgi:hypothetical protein